MHVALAIISIIAVWIRGDWRKWETYFPTMMYFAVGNLTYNFLCASYFLWRLNPDTLSNHTLTEMLYTFITFPLTALMFLARYPENETRWKVFKHYLAWVSIYVFVELILVFTNGILYKYGWNLVWSAIFDILMFPMLRLFSKKPLLALVLSVPIAFVWIWLFDVPVHIPVEDR
ncbi:hypothetical protein EJF36_20535 [Bacillus sp. HMF5848]|uniref:CBO0543 family protein n=1 Tax=Bacillus sp. HMF5848 TaxID=2495421 RepID=UPI000F7765F4|nr:CBO0543 family protein [Bacillus sp. HMF5848]RSK29076.1 hypothetical protein EJF36_20535 [Bacillus sp. HMF5848]